MLILWLPEVHLLAPYVLFGIIVFYHPDRQKKIGADLAKNPPVERGTVGQKMY